MKPIKCSNNDCCNTSDFCMCPNPGKIQFNLTLTQDMIEHLWRYNKKFAGKLSMPNLIRVILDEKFGLNNE